MGFGVVTDRKVSQLKLPPLRDDLLSIGNWRSEMKCYLCELQAQQSEADQGEKLIDCPDCGTYKISNLVLKELTSKKLDYPKMRDELHRQRQFNATSLAEINTETAIWA
jgi:DNA-directed RNA polymerase subunit RPC12/RpoP